MARVTIEDCTNKVSSRFELVVVAAERVRAIASGARLTVERLNDKNSVVALREISNGNLDIEMLKQMIIKKHRKVQRSEMIDKPEDLDLVESNAEIEMEMKNLVSTDNIEDNDSIEISDSLEQ